MNIEKLNKSKLNQLLQTSAESEKEDGPLKVSLIAPMESSGPEVQQNVIRWKNAVSEAKEKLAEAGIDEDKIKSYLEPAEQKLEDESFWQHQTKSLAYFCDGVDSHFFSHCCKTDPNVTVAETYHVAPLAAAATESSNAYILACSPKRVRLLLVEGDQIEDLHPDCLPENLKDALNIDEYVSSLQHHTTSSPTHGGDSAAVHHGHGASDPDVKKQDELLQYFHRLNDGLNEYFESETTPLIFAGVEYLFPIFKKACHYKNLHHDVIAGNCDDCSPEELLEKSSAVLEQLRNSKVMQQLSDYEEKQHSDWASHDLVEIEKAAGMGQVQKLFLKDVANYDQAKLNQAIISTIQCGGDVICVADGDTQSAGDFAIAALFRSPAGSFLQSV